MGLAAKFPHQSISYAFASHRQVSVAQILFDGPFVSYPTVLEEISLKNGGIVQDTNRAYVCEMCTSSPLGFSQWDCGISNLKSRRIFKPLSPRLPLSRAPAATSPPASG